MITVIDSFFKPSQLKFVTKEIKKLSFYSASEHPDEPDDVNFPGIRTSELLGVNPFLSSFIIQQIESSNISMTNGSWSIRQFGHLRRKKDNKEDWIHTDSSDWAYILYLSKTNLESGTKIYPSVDSKKDEEDGFIKFKQNRIVCLNSSVPHMAWGNHGNDLTNGRLVICGFANYV